MKEIVVFGGTGFIGSPLVTALVRAGHRVRVASRNAVPRAGNPCVMRADVSDPASVDEVVAGADVVFDLAASGGATWADFERSIVGGARNVAEACLRHGVQRLVYTSTSAALYLGGSGRTDEQDGTDPQPEKRSLYSRAKIAAEKVLLELHREQRLPVVILRPAVVVGKGGLLSHGGLGLWPSPTRCVGRGDGRTPVPFVLVKDVVQALLAAMEAPRVDGMAFNLAGDVRLSARDYVRLVGERTARDFRFRPKSLLAHQADAVLRWAVKAVGGKKDNPFPSWRDLSSRTMARQIDNRLAKRHLGWIPTNDLASFLAEAIDSHVRPLQPGDLRKAS